MSERASHAFDWVFLFQWLMATTAGWFLGWLLLPAVALVTAGIGAGVAQCAVLYGQVPRAWRWILATALGWGAGLTIMIVAVPPGIALLSGAVLGAATGTAQWLVLRPQIHWAGWWIPVSALAWALGMSLAPSSDLVALPRIVLSGVLSAVMTGIVLELLLRFPKPLEEQDTEIG